MPCYLLLHLNPHLPQSPLLVMCLGHNSVTQMSIPFLWMSTEQLIILLTYVDEEERPLSWEERLQIALDISHGIEYLHDGVCCVV